MNRCKKIVWCGLLLSNALSMAMTEVAMQHADYSCVIQGRTGSYTITFPTDDIYQGPASANLAEIVNSIAVGDWQSLQSDGTRLKALAYNELERVQCYCAHRQAAVEITADLWSNPVIEAAVILLQAQYAAMPEDNVESDDGLFGSFPDMDKCQSYIPKIDRVQRAQERKWQATDEWHDDHKSALGIFDRLHKSPSAPYIATILQALAQKSDDDAAVYLVEETYAVAATVELLNVIKEEEWIQRHYGCRHEAPLRRSMLPVQDTGVAIKEEADRIYFCHDGDE